MALAASGTAIVFHSAAAFIYAYTIYYSFSLVKAPKSDPNLAYAVKAKYLTQWNLGLCGLYFGLCLVLDVRPTRSLYRLRDYIFCSILLPSCIFVNVFLWGLYSVDRETVFSTEIEAFHSKWVNRHSHTLVTITAVCEALLYPHEVPAKRRGFAGIFAWFGFYQLWVLYLGIGERIWVYPVMRILSPSAMTVFFVGCCVVAFVLQTICNIMLRLRYWVAAPRTEECKRA
ncbi:androgen-dependent TFPI-regulating protein [Galendromus occidentalis]|uniref:Androgen-dependent TFPI-regulating protein n=1 Tax=Galendromus occidentalis TaxID=34638 RepID=A0AAJ6VZQ5_9ACAR|nr:androgen-dependent TFPI-regulating protein [Galendromus occidentalis]